jgi:hypothetical protein
VLTADMEAGRYTPEGGQAQAIDVRWSCSVSPGVEQRTGDTPGLLRRDLYSAFAVVVLGGLGSVWGAYLGGLIVGVVEALAGFYIDPVLRSAIWFLIFLVVLVVKPAGLLGQVGAEEVGFREQH